MAVLEAEYKPTPKNQPIKDFLPNAGFTSPSTGTLFELEIDKHASKQSSISCAIIGLN